MYTQALPYREKNYLTTPGGLPAVQKLCFQMQTHLILKNQAI